MARWVESTWLLGEVDGAVVGRSSIRFELNDFLLAEGGHIGYAVRPAIAVVVTRPRSCGGVSWWPGPAACKTSW